MHWFLQYADFSMWYGNVYRHVHLLRVLTHYPYSGFRVFSHALP